MSGSFDRQFSTAAATLRIRLPDDRLSYHWRDRSWSRWKPAWSWRPRPPRGGTLDHVGDAPARFARAATSSSRTRAPATTRWPTSSRPAAGSTTSAATTPPSTPTAGPPRTSSSRSGPAHRRPGQYTHLVHRPVDHQRHARARRRRHADQRLPERPAHAELDARRPRTGADAA